MDINQHYSQLWQQYGDDPRSVQLADRVTQRRRFTLLCEVSRDIRRASILDVGCGLAHLHEYLLEHGYEGDYTGIDVNPDFVAECRRKFPKSRFELLDISQTAASWQVDYVLLNGVFNNARADSHEFVRSCLRNMFAACRVGMAFNAMSTYVDRFDPELVYFDPEELFGFCKEELSPLVNLRHEYFVRPGIVPFEFALMVYKTDVAPRKRLAYVTR
jgi:SAM-dependent methyltransferase